MLCITSKYIGLAVAHRISVDERHWVQKQALPGTPDTTCREPRVDMLMSVSKWRRLENSFHKSSAKFGIYYSPIVA